MDFALNMKKFKGIRFLYKAILEGINFDEVSDTIGKFNIQLGNVF